MAEKIIEDCFVCVPFPQSEHDRYDLFIKQVKGYAPELHYPFGEWPRVTARNLRAQPEGVLDSVQQLVEECGAMLKGTSIHISGFGYLLSDFPFMAYLRAQVPSQFQAFRRALEQNLSVLAAGDRHDYTPHVPVARIRTPDERRAFRRREEELRQMGQRVDWTFPVRELGIWGRANRHSPARPLRTIAI